MPARLQPKARPYCIVFRTGGTANFQWHRSLPMTRDEALSRRLEMEQGGHTCYAVDYAQSVSIGLPSTFAPNTKRCPAMPEEPPHYACDEACQHACEGQTA